MSIILPSDLRQVDEQRLFMEEDIYRPVMYKGKKVPFAIAKMDMWKHDIRLWAIEQVYTKDESDGKAKLFPDKAYFWDVLNLLDAYGILICPKTRRMMMTHLSMSLKCAHNLLFMKNSFNCCVTLREDTAIEHLGERTLFTLEHLDYRFPYPHLTVRGTEGIKVTANSLENLENNASVNAYPSGSGKVRGMTVTFGLFDEYAHQTNQKGNFEAVLPALEGINCRGMFVSSVEPNTYMEELCTDIAADAPYVEVSRGTTYSINRQGACVLHLNYRADPDKDPDTPAGLEWFKKERKKYDQYTWLKEYEGRWRFPIQGRVFYRYNKEAHSTDFDEKAVKSSDKPIHIGFDPGWRFPAVCVAWTNPVGQLCVKQVIMGQNVDIKDFIENTVFSFLDKEFGYKWKGRDHWYIDPAGKAQSGHGSDGAKRMLAGILKHNRIYHQYTEVEDRVQMINMLLHSDRILVAPQCGIFYPSDGKKSSTGVFIDMLEWGYQHEEPKSEGRYQDTKPRKDNFFDHMADAFGYIIAVMFKEDMLRIRNDKLKKQSKKVYKDMPWLETKPEPKKKSKSPFSKFFRRKSQRS
jgi:hypothetical protein